MRSWPLLVFYGLRCKLKFCMLLLQGKLDIYSTEANTRTRRAAAGFAANISDNQSNDLLKIRNEIKSYFEKIRKESNRVCTSPLGSVRTNRLSFRIS